MQIDWNKLKKGTLLRVIRAPASSILKLGDIVKYDGPGILNYQIHVLNKDNERTGGWDTNRFVLFSDKYKPALKRNTNVGKR